MLLHDNCLVVAIAGSACMCGVGVVCGVLRVLWVDQCMNCVCCCVACVLCVVRGRMCV